MTEKKHLFNFAEDFIGYANIKVIGVGGASFYQFVLIESPAKSKAALEPIVDVEAVGRKAVFAQNLRQRLDASMKPRIFAVDPVHRGVEPGEHRHMRWLGKGDLGPGALEDHRVPGERVEGRGQ